MVRIFVRVRGAGLSDFELALGGVGVLPYAAQHRSLFGVCSVCLFVARSPSSVEASHGGVRYGADLPL